MGDEISFPYVDVNDVKLDSGAVENVRVHELKVSKWKDLQALGMDEGALIEFAASKPAGWYETVSPSATTPLWEAFEKANASFLKRAERLWTKVYSLQNVGK